jgi:hypothetical protein
MADFLTTPQHGDKEEYCLVDYRLDNTLSESGNVSRGVCTVDDNDYLVDIQEHKKIFRNGNTILSATPAGDIEFTGAERVSMNLMGFLPTMFTHLDRQFRDFLTASIARNDAEYYLPSAMNGAIKDGLARVKVIATPEKWFGVTYREDRDMVMNSLKALVDEGIYPTDLWS